MRIPTQFRDEMEQAELHSSQLVNVEVSIYSFFLNMKTEISSGSDAKAETTRGKPCRKTIAAVFLASLLEVRDSEWPKPDDVANNIHQPRQRGHLSQSHFAKIVSTAFNHDAQRLWVGSRWIQSSKRDRASRKQWKQFFVSSVWATWCQKLDSPTLRACTRFPDTFCSIPQECVTHRNWHQRCPTADRTQNLPRDDQFAAGIAMIAINHAHSHTVTTLPPPRPHEHPSTGTTFLKLKPKLLMRLHPLNDPIKNPWKHSIQKDWLKQMNEQTCDKEPTHTFRRTYGSTKTSLRDQVTLTLTRLALKTNRSHRRSTNS